MSGFDTKQFVENNRIHVEHGSIFYDQFVQVHPRELRAENESKLVAKLDKIWSQDAPSFFASYPRGAVAQYFASMVPISADVQQGALKKQLESVNYLKKNGITEDYRTEWESRQQPFAHLVDGDAQKPQIDPAAKEFLGNGFKLYMILDEALSQRGYPKELVYYLKRGHSMEALLSDLEDPLGVSAHRLMDVAATQGVRGVAGMLGVKESFVRELDNLVDAVADKHFSDNMIQHWQIGRRMPEYVDGSVADKINAGRLPRIGYAIQSMNAQVAQHDIPAPLKAQEQMVAGALKRLPPVMQEALFAVGAEISYTPEMTVDPIAPGAQAHGYHMKLVKNPGDVDGVYQIFLSGKEDAEAFARVLVHEAHHLFFPQRFKADEIKQVDALANQGYARLTDLKLMMDAWYVGTPKQREAIEWKIDTDYKVNGMGLKDALGGRTMNQFYDMVEHAYDRLNIHSRFFTKTGYNTAPEKFYEMVARYSELRCVRLEDNPKLLEFIAPEIGAIYDQHYILHVAEQLAELKQGKAQQTPETPQVMGKNQPVSVAVPAMLDHRHSVPMTHIAADSAQLAGAMNVSTPRGVDELISATGEHGHGDRVRQQQSADVLDFQRH